MVRHVLLFVILCLASLTVKAHRLKLTCYIPENNPTGTAVIVCPGGSYFWLDTELEGETVAQWLNANGIAAFVLEYRHAGWAAFAYHIRGGGRSFPSGYNDLLSALKQVRDRALFYGIRADRVGCIGFSAGGHLVMHAAEQLAGTTTEMAFAAVCYPVVSMTHPCTHKRSRRGLLGEFPKKSLKDSLSLENHVPNNCPPVFLMNCDDDPVVNPHNSILLDSALTVHNVTHQYMHYKTGGHGFGASAAHTTAEAIAWKMSFLEWLANILKW